MTWFANYIFAEPKQTVISKFCTIPEILNRLYLVADLDGYNWFDKRVCHGLPSEGLLVGREICNLESYEAKWHGDDAISWDAFVGPDNIEVIQPEILLSSEDIHDDLEEAHLKEAQPPAGFLHFLKWVNLTTNSVISFYYCATWGGDTEQEFAWVFSDEDKVFIQTLEIAHEGMTRVQ